MIRRVLIADRGDGARRVSATCRLVGIEAVAVYSDLDADAPHVSETDRAVHLPGSAPTATYQRPDLLIAAARKAGADAIHPGWGGLATDPDFAGQVTDAGLTWVGPPAKTLSLLSDSRAVASQLTDAGVAVLTDDTVPAAGYGEPSRRLDVQVITDMHGNTLVFAEREVSIRHGLVPLLAETPSPVVPPELREEITRTASAAANALGCVGAVTVGLVLTADGTAHVRELAPRLPPEHGASECSSGLDLVRLQLLVAEGSPLPSTWAPPLRGHTIAVSLRAEDPAYAWEPTTGPLHRFTITPVRGQFRPLPEPGLRLDPAIEAGGRITARYDPTIATLTGWAPTRYEAARLLAGALARARLHGLTTNRDLLVRVLRHPTFLAGAVDTRFLDEHPEVFAPLLASVDGCRLSYLAAALAAASARRTDAAVLGSLSAGWRNLPSGAQTAVYEGPMGTVEIGYRLDRIGELASWWVRAVDPDELDLAGLGQPSSIPDDHPPVALLSVAADRVELDVAGVRLTFAVHRVGGVSYVDSTEGSLVLTELSRYPLPAAPDDLP